MEGRRELNITCNIKAALQVPRFVISAAWKWLATRLTMEWLMEWKRWLNSKQMEGMARWSRL